MFDFISQKQTSLIGVDIGSSSVRVVELEKHKDQYKIHSYGSQALPEDVFEGKHIKDIEKLSFAIQEAVDNANTKTTSVAVAVPDSSVITKIIQLDRDLSDSEREELVIIEADKHIPYPIDEVSLDYEIIGPNAKNDSRDDILVVATRGEIVNSLIELMKASGLQAKVVDVESYVVERAASLFAQEMPNEGSNSRIAIFDIGEIYTKLTVLDDRKAVFSREETFGFRQLAEEISRRYDIPTDKVTKLRKRGQLPDDARVEVIEPFKETISMQGKRALHFYYSAVEEHSVDQILLFGGVGSLPDVQLTIERLLEIPTKLINPIAKMSLGSGVDVKALNNESSSLLIASGLALRKFEA